MTTASEARLLGTTPTESEVPLPSGEATVVPDGSVFGDNLWDLSPLCPRPTTRNITLNFERCPVALREDIKHFFYVILNRDTPLDQLDRPASVRRRLAPSTVKATWHDLLPFLEWLAVRGTPQLAELDEDDLREYAAHIASWPIGPNTKSRRLFVLSRLWLLSPYMRSNARLRQPFWEREGMEQVIGKIDWTSENKSIPVHPATMSALLLWCLRLVEEAPRLLHRLSLSTSPVSRPDNDGSLPWSGEFDQEQAAAIRRLVVTACLITVTYLTGMRADEVSGLRRGCCTPNTNSTNRPSVGYEIRGRTYKSAVASGRSIPEGIDREHPWVAIKPVADAIAVMEGLHDGDLLFSDSFFRVNLTGSALDPSGPASKRVRDAITRLCRWCNQRAIDLDRPHDVIPEDPAGPISLRRLRRTLAWFIYRRPGGRVGLGIQYGHLHAATTDGYGSRVSAGLRGVFSMEEAFAVTDTLHKAAENLETNPHVSGPAAARYRAAASEYRDRFGGLTLTTKQSAALIANPNMRVYDAPGQTLACCFDPRKALCRKDVPTQTVTTPDLTACDHRCANIARTDEHIDTLHAELDALQEEVDSPTTPEPMRHRIRGQISRREGIIRSHRDAQGNGEP